MVEKTSKKSKKFPKSLSIYLSIVGSLQFLIIVNRLISLKLPKMGFGNINEGVLI